MKAQSTTLSKKAKDGKEFKITVDFIDYETGREWLIDYDDCFTWATKKEAIYAAKCTLINKVEDYEYDNDLM